MSTLRDLKVMVDAAINSYGDDAPYILNGDGEGPVVELELIAKEGGSNDALIQISANSEDYVIPETEW